MNVKLRRKLEKRKRRVCRRIDKKNWDGRSPMINPAKVQYELADKQHAIAAGGIGAVVQLVSRLGLADFDGRMSSRGACHSHR